MDPKAAIGSLEAQLNQLKVAYEQYFLGIEPRVPAQLRQTVEQAIRDLSTAQLQNTADRYRFKSIQQRYQSFRRRWDETLRKIEAGTYQRHLFKANLRQKARQEAGAAPATARGAAKRGGQGGGSLYDDYLQAARECGQNVRGLTPEKLRAVMKKQEAAIRAKHDVSSVRFRVAVEDGRVRLKASVRR